MVPCTSFPPPLSILLLHRHSADYARKSTKVTHEYISLLIEKRRRKPPFPPYFVHYGISEFKLGKKTTNHDSSDAGAVRTRLAHHPSTIECSFQPSPFHVNAFLHCPSAPRKQKNSVDHLVSPGLY